MKDLPRIPSKEITPPEIYYSRRNLIKAGLLVASAAATGYVYRQLNRPGAGKPNAGQVAPQALSGLTETGTTSDRIAQGFLIDEPKTPFESVTGYNNFYEFTTDKEEVASKASKFIAKPWQISIEGLCRKPRVFGLEDILALSAPEERVYRMRCVEAWSIVVPWAGFSLSKLLDAVEPLSDAKYVAFETLNDPNRFPGQKSGALPWPYVEGLRMDEAMHPLTLLASGLYGRELPAQNGAPLRLVIPWKYGFKGIKSIVKITLSATQPPTTWNIQGPDEYGFLANVNPTVDHPRWSQATEQRLGESGRRPTLMFNGYSEQVGKLYAGLDLRKNY